MFLLTFSAIYIVIGLVFIRKGFASGDENERRIGYTAFFLGIALVAIFVGINPTPSLGEILQGLFPFPPGD